MTSLKYRILCFALIAFSINSIAAINDHFVTTWKTDNPGTSNNTSISLPIYGNNRSYDVDWNNDGIFDEFGISDTISHDFGTVGVKTIRIKGTYPFIFFNHTGDNQKMISIDQWGTNPWQTMRYAYGGAINLVINATDTPNLSICEDISYMFSGATSIGKPTENSNWNWNTSTITNMSHTFDGATSFNKDIGDWNTGSVSYESFTLHFGFYKMFNNATSFNQDIGEWDTSNFVNLASMFENATSFDQDISSWNIENTLYLNSIFKNTSLSVENYDALLTAWSAQNVRSNLVFDAGNSVYCSQTAQDARDELISNYSWTIYDQGQCQPELTIVSNSSIFVDENQVEVIKIESTDPDFDNILYSITGGNDQSFFSLDTITGILTFNNPPDYENPLDMGNNNSYIVEVTASDDGSPQEVVTQIITVYINNVFEDLLNDHFVTTWKTDNPGLTNDTSIIIKTTGSLEYLYDVDWNNDGVFDEFGITGQVSHDFGVAGIVTIRIRGIFPSLRFYLEGDAGKIISIDQWGTIPWESMRFAFSDAINLINNAVDAPNLSNCVGLRGMFKGAIQVGSTSETSNWNWDTSNIIYMHSAFEDATLFNKDISKWNTSKVEYMDYMFGSATAFNHNIGNWDVTNVKNMRSMFANADSFDQDLSQWNISKVEDFKNIFNNIRLSVENYDALLTNWSTKIMLQDLTFDGGRSIYCSQAAIDAHSNITTTKNWDIYDRGQCKPGLNIVSNDVIFSDENTTSVIQVTSTNSNFDNVSYAITGGEDQSFFNIGSMSGLLSFSNPQDYENPQDLNNNNSFLVEITATDDGNPQQSSSQLLTVFIKNVFENLPTDHFVTTWKTDNDGISNDSSITLSPLNDGSDYSYNVDWDNDGIFEEFGLTGDVIHDFGTPGIKTIRISGLFPRIDFEYNEDRKKIISIDQWGTNPWRSMGNAFWNASNLINNATDIPNLSNTSYISSMFYGASSIGGISETGNWNWDTSNISSMSSVFYGASMFNKDISNWNTSQVISMGFMFSFADLFNQNIGNWDTANVTYISNMFSLAHSFDQNLSQWNIEKVSSMDYVFNNIRLSIENYDAILIGWSLQNLKPNIEFDGGNSVYCSQLASDARDNIISVHNWRIYDNGKCLPTLSIISDNIVFANENQAHVIQVIATDPNFDIISYSLTGGEDVSSFSIDTVTGVVTFIFPPDFENPQDANNNNEFIIEVTATDNGNPQESTTQTLKVFIANVYESLPNDDFVTTWKTDNPGNSNDTSVKIKVASSLYDYSYNIDWDNDGVFDEFAITDDITHDFGTSGYKTIRISGNFPYINFFNGGDPEKLISIDQWGSHPWKSMNFSYTGTTNLINKALDSPNLSICNDLTKMFSGASKIGASIENSNWNWDTSQVTHMNYMFENASDFNQDISNWKTGNTSNFAYMFKNATSFNQDIGNWDVSNVFSFEDMFFSASSFNKGIGFWNTSRARIMKGMFNNSTSFNQNIGFWDTSNVDDMRNMFSDAYYFDQDLSLWNIENLSRDLEEMFNNVSLSVENYDALLVSWASQNIPSNLTFDAGSSTYCSSDAQLAHENLTTNYNWKIFDDGPCLPFLTIISKNKIFTPENQQQVIQIITTDPDFDNVTYTITGGDDAVLFSIDPVTGVLIFISSPDYENPTDFNSDNYYIVEVTATDDGNPQEVAVQLLTIYVTNVFENLPSDHFVTTWNTGSLGFISLVTGLDSNFNVDWNNDGVFDEFGLFGEVRHDYSIQGIKTIRISGFISSMSLSNFNKEKLISIDQWGTNQWKNMSHAFKNAKNITNKANDIPNLSNCTGLDHMFQGADSIGKDTETGNWDWDTSNIKYMLNTFAGAENFNKDISKWDTSKVISMNSMFLLAEDFNQDIGNWDTANVVSMKDMFNNASSFDQDLSTWDVEKISDFESMFENARLSVENYDSLLIGWTEQNLLISRDFDAGNSIYCSADAQLAHEDLISFHRWMISDGGLCAPILTIVSENIVDLNENIADVIRVLTTDPDFHTPSFSISGGDDELLFNIDSTTGLLSFIDPPDFENPNSAANSNTYFVEVMAIDDGIPQETAIQMITVNIIDIPGIEFVDLIYSNSFE